jgi:hypothetical protein
MDGNGVLTCVACMCLYFSGMVNVKAGELASV